VGVNAEIQLTFVDASHAHSGCAVMLRDPVPPTASITTGTPSDTTHLTGLGPALTVVDVSQPDTSDATSNAALAVTNPRRATLTRSTVGLGIGSFAPAKRHSSRTVRSPYEFTRRDVSPELGNFSQKGTHFPSLSCIYRRDLYRLTLLNDPWITVRCDRQS
jgi:hypothetical protein